MGSCASCVNKYHKLLKADVGEPETSINKSKKNFRQSFAKGVLPAAHNYQLIQTAKTFEPKVTNLLQELATVYHGKLEGLEYRFKTLASLQEKVDRDVFEANLNLLDDMGAKRGEKTDNMLRFSSFETSILMIDVEIVGESDSEEEEERLDEPKQQKKKRISILDAFTTSDKIETSADENAAKQRRVSRMIHSSQKNLLDLEKSLSSKFTEEIKQAHQNELDIQNGVLDKSTIDVGKLVWNVSDALRYTIILELDTYTESVNKIMDRLAKAGMFAVSLKNFWPSGDGYQGINNVFGLQCSESLTGIFKFEVQFHTQASFDWKMSSHELYENFRATIDPDIKLSIFKECCRLADEIPVPPQVLTIPTPKIRATPFLEGLYVDLLIARALKFQDAAILQVNKASANLPLGDGFTPVVRAELMTRKGIENRLIHETQTLKKSRRRSSLPDQPLSQDYEGEMFKEAVMAINDSLVINVLLPEETYSIATAIIMTRLFAADLLSSDHNTFKEVSSTNGWRVPASFSASGVNGGIGVLCNVSMKGANDGVAFTPEDDYPLVVAFHTKSSLQAMFSLQAARSEFRSASTPVQRQKALSRAREAVLSVPVPKGALMLLSNSLADYHEESPRQRPHRKNVCYPSAQSYESSSLSSSNEPLGTAL